MNFVVDVPDSAERRRGRIIAAGGLVLFPALQRASADAPGTQLRWYVTAGVAFFCFLKLLDE